jgi:retinoblastoma-associated protein
VNDVLQIVDLKAFDFWRLLNSFLKFDPQMPKSLNDHFRQTEIKIVSEDAWRNGSPVVLIIKEVMTA